MFDINGSRCIDFVNGLSSTLCIFNKKMYPLKVVDVGLVVCNRKDDYNFSPYVELVGETIVLNADARSDIEQMKGIQKFYLDLTLNDCTYVRVVVEGCVGSKYKMRLISSDNTYRFIHRDFIKKVWSGQKWSMDFSDTSTSYTCKVEEFHNLLHPDYCAVLLMPEECSNIPEFCIKSAEDGNSIASNKEESIYVNPTITNNSEEEKGMDTYFYKAKIGTAEEPGYLKDIRSEVVAVSRTSTAGSISFNPEFVQKAVALLPVTGYDLEEQKALKEAAKTTPDGKDYVDPEKVYTFIEAYIAEFNKLAEACTARTGVLIPTVSCSSIRPKGYVKPQDRSFKSYTARMLDGLQNIVTVLNEKDCSIDKLVIMFCLDHYSEAGATELKLDAKDIQKYRENIIEIASEKSWVKIEVQVPFMYNGGQDVIKVYIYEEGKNVCIDYFSQNETEMFLYVGPRAKGPILNKPIEGGSYEGDVGLLANIIHPDWLKKTSRAGGSLMDIIKGI